MICLHVIAAGKTNPMNMTLSNYVFTEGAEWMFGISLTCMAVGGIGALLSLSVRTLSRGRTIQAALWLSISGLLVAAAFPTDPGVALSLSAEIHRIAAGVVFCCVPLAALLIAARSARHPHLAGTRKWIRVTAAISVVILGLFLFSPLAVMPDVVTDLRGGFQRLLLVAELALLAQLTYLPARHHAARPQVYFGHAGD